MGEFLTSFDPERLSRRVGFLRSRAEAHLRAESENVLNPACAATLLRDAACVSILMGEVSAARELLRSAGRILLGLGLAAGSTLIALSSAYDAQAELLQYSDVIDGVRRQWDRTESRERSEYIRPMTEMSRGSPRQMLSVLQTDWLVAEVDERRSLRDDTPLRVAVGRNAGYPAGETGLSIDRYASCADWMLEHRGLPAVEPPELIQTAMATIAMTRAERIRAAMKDSYHWSMLPRPAELLDLDAVVLMFLALGSGMNEKDLQNFQQSDVPLANAPLRAAIQLRNDQGLGSRPSFRR